MPLQVVEDQQQTQRRKRRRERERVGQALLPVLPMAPILKGIQFRRLFGQAGQDLFELAFQPRVQDLIRRSQHALHPYHPAGWVEQRQHLCDTIADIFVSISNGFAQWTPLMAGIRSRLVRASLVGGPERQPILAVPPVDQVFFATVSGS